MNDKNLKNYKKKRDFTKTKEPKGGNPSSLPSNFFVIHKHDARTLHYDFRLRIGDVLVSWAVPKGLSTIANEKRLAIRTEDHPLDYAHFEGVIPEGEYGAGTVLIWDKGEYEAVEETSTEEKRFKDTLKKGTLKFNLKGQKLKGGYALVKMGERKGKEQWIIFKLDDEYADAHRNPLSTEPNSV